MTLKFPDLSHYKTGVDVSRFPALITKATEGTTFVDSTFSSYRAAAVKAGISFLPYHFLHHGNIAAQVAHVVSVVGKRTLMLDVESEPNQPDSTLADVEAFMDAYAAVGGRVVLNYIPKWFHASHWGSPSLKPLADRGAGLISSQYTTYSDTGPGWAAYGGLTPVIWQYTATPMDMNAFKGTQAELADLFAGTTAGHASAPTTGEDIVTPEDVAAIANAVWHTPQLGPGSSKSGSAYMDKLAALQGSVAALVANADPKALAAELAPLLLAAGGGSITEANVEQALRNVFADAGTAG